jgi:hypothetical protein
MIVHHRQGVLTIRGRGKVIYSFATCCFDEFVGELGLLILVLLFKLAFDNNLRLRAVAGLLVESLALGLD